MEKRINRLNIVLLAIIGNLNKLYFFYIVYVKKRMNRSKNIASKVIVSMTSYGRRLYASTPYAIFSILNQTVRPEKVVLWLDETKWNKDNLPKRIKRLILLGLEVEFCKDIKVYTKLLPALKKYPDKSIITVDDDIWYSKRLVEKLHKCHSANSKCIIANEIAYPTYENGILNPPSKWIWIWGIRKKEKKQLDNNLVYALGVGGVLYPPNSLNGKVLEEEVFLKLCPFADDVWLYIMAVMNNTPRLFNKQQGNKYPIDAFYQKTHYNSSLKDINSQRGGEFNNDTQFQSVVDYYNVKL